MTPVKNNLSSMCVSGSKLPRHRQSRNGFWSLSIALLLGCACHSVYAIDLEEHRVEDIDYGRALYHFFQDNKLSAITHLLVAEARPRIRNQVNESELLLADLLYGYGLYEESRELFARLLSAEVSDSVQNRIWFNLARLRYDQGFFEPALDLLSRINDQLPRRIESERKYLLTNLLLGAGEYQKAADISNQINSESIWKIYARYNLGVTLIEGGNYKQGRFLLDQIGQMETVTPELKALKDRANLSLGLKQLRMELPEPALESLSRIRLEGPLSNQALLASGWAWFRLDKLDQSLIPWRLLLKRNAVDAATQEAILAIPANYAESGDDKLALRHYEIAANQFDLQLQLLSNAVTSVKNDGLIAALRENAILYDRSSLQRLPPSSDVTPQLHILLASTEFQREIKRYQELIDIRNSLRYWANNFPALELMLKERRQGFELNLPKLQRSTSFDQLEQLSDRRDQFATEVADIEATEDYLALANSTEQDHLETLESVSGAIGKFTELSDTADQQDMFRMLSGIVHYELSTDYPVRVWKAKKQLMLLDRALANSELQAQDLRQITERTDLEFGLFQDRIAGQSQRILNLRNNVANLLKQQEQHINQLAIDELRRQQQHIVQLRLNARFELAKLYDRLTAE